MEIINTIKNLRDTLNKPADYGFVEERAFGKKVPKVIHQIAINYAGFPQEINDNISKLKALNPTWEYRLYDEAAVKTYINSHYPALINLYERISPAYGAAKADFFRYLLLYNEGGVYLDLKSTIKQPLDEVINDDDLYVLSHWKNAVGEIHEGMGLHKPVTKVSSKGEFQQWFIISAKGHPYLKAVIENVSNNIVCYNPILHHVGGWGVLSVTGPIAYTLAIHAVKQKWSSRQLNSNEDIGFEYSIYEAKGLAFRHHKILKKHYTESAQPIVEQSWWMKVVYWFVSPILRYVKYRKRSAKVLKRT